MRVQNYKHILVAVLSALMLFVLVPAASADPGSGQVTSAIATVAEAVSQPSQPGDRAQPGDSGGPGQPAATGLPSVDSPSQTTSSPSDSQAPGAATQPSASPVPSPPQSTPDPAQTPATPAADSATSEPASSSTTQAIWQVQSLGCTAHCQGTTQSQTAQQTNLTIHPSTASAVESPAAGETSTGSRQQLVQLQLGCLAHCFGSTTVVGSAHGGQGAVQQFLASSAPPDLPNQDPPHGPTSVVRQSSFQLQDGGGLVGSQSQVAEQFGVTAEGTGGQLKSLSVALGSGTSDGPSLLENLGAALGSLSPAPETDPSGVQAINQVEQAIWQLQIGCLIFCSQTTQSQQAQQSNTAVGVISGRTTPTSNPVPAVAALPAPTTVYQLIWQVQVGCLFWCYDAVETQAASSLNTVETFVIPDPPTGTSGSGDGGGSTPTPPAPVLPVTTGAPVALPWISSPAPGPISAGGVTRIAAGSQRRGEPALRRGKLSLPPLPVLGLPQPTRQPVASAGEPAFRSELSALGMVSVAVASSAVAWPSVASPRAADRVGRSAPARSEHTSPSTGMPAQQLPSPGGTPLWFVALCVLMGLVATAVVVTDLRDRWVGRAGN